MIFSPINIEVKNKDDLCIKVLQLFNAYAKNPLTNLELKVMAQAIQIPMTIENPLNGISSKEVYKKAGINKEHFEMIRTSLYRKGHARKKGYLSDAYEVLRKELSKPEAKSFSTLFSIKVKEIKPINSLHTV